jgi:hypothetical protein
VPNPKPMQFIVQGEPVKSGRLAEHLKLQPAVQQVAQVASDVVILSMTATEAERLKAEFDSLVVEPDSPLNQNQQ